MVEIVTQRKDIRALTGVHLYHNNMSNCSMRVRMVLDEKGIDYESHHVELKTHENLTDDFRALNPNAVVPVLVHDGRTHIESNDIIDYIDADFEGPSLLPRSEQDQKLVDDLLLRSGKLQSSLKTLSFEFLLKPQALKTAGSAEEKLSALEDKSRAAFMRDFGSNSGLDKATILSNLAEVTEAFQHLEQILEKQEWLSGPDFGLGDVSWLPNIHRTSQMLYPLNDFPRLKAWFKRCKERSSYRSAILNFQPLRLRFLLMIYGRFRVLKGTSVRSYLRP